jgi:hypothetical protein
VGGCVLKYVVVTEDSNATNLIRLNDTQVLTEIFNQTVIALNQSQAQQANETARNVTVPSDGVVPGRLPEKNVSSTEIIEKALQKYDNTTHNSSDLNTYIVSQPNDTIKAENTTNVSAYPNDMNYTVPDEAEYWFIIVNCFKPGVK